MGQDVLGRSLFGTSFQTWLLLGLTWVGLTLLLVAIRNVAGRRYARFTERTRFVVDTIVARTFQKTKTLFLVILGLWLAALLLRLSPRILRVMNHVVLLALLVQIGLWGGTFISLYVQSYQEERYEIDAATVTSMQALGFIGHLLLWTVLLLVALDNFGVDITALIAGLGIGGIAVALALQNVLSDLFASLSIVLDKPFVVGDFLIIGEYLGTVENIGLKTTRLRSLSGEQLVFSNSDLLNSRIQNYKKMKERRAVFTVGVTYQTPHNKLETIPALLQEAVESQDPVRFDRAHFKEFGDSALIFEVVYYVLEPDYNLYMDIQQGINLGIVERFEEHDIEIAYPTRSVFVRHSEVNGETDESARGHSPPGSAEGAP